MIGECESAMFISSALLGTPASASAATSAEGGIGAWMEHLSVDKEVCEFGRGFGEFRIRIECVWDAFESVEFRRDLHLAELFKEAFATFQRDGDVRRPVENNRRWESLRNIGQWRGGAMRGFVASGR